MKRKNKGITLVALVITIIILLILAGISIAGLTGENGILNKTKEAGEKYTISRLQEQLELVKIPVQIDKEKVNLDNYLEELDKYTDEYKIKYIDKVDENEAYTVLEEKYKFLIRDKENGDVEIIYQGIASLLRLSETSGNYIYPESKKVTVIENESGGELSVSSSDEEIATISVNGNEILVQSGTKEGIATITVISAAKGNYGENRVKYTAIVGVGTIQVTATPYSGTYDGNAHGITVTATPSDAKIEYSTDGTSYSTTKPTYTDVGEYTIYYKVSKEGYKTVEGSLTVVITKATAGLTLSATSGTYTYPTSGTFTITENASGGTLTVSSANDNIATATISGNTVTVKPGTTAGEATITVKSAATGNYDEKTTTYKATVKNGTIQVTATPYSGTYDGNSHGITVTATPSDAKIEYSTDGTSYSTTKPTYTDVGTYTTYYKVSKTGYKTVEGSLTVKLIEEKITASIDFKDLLKITEETNLTFNVSSNNEIKKVQVLLDTIEVYSETLTNVTTYSKTNIGIQNLKNLNKVQTFGDCTMKIIATSITGRSVETSYTVKNYTVGNEKCLNSFAKVVNNGDTLSGETIIQLNDITTTTDYVPIGYITDYTNYSTWTGPVFKGIYDGKNYSITISGYSLPSSIESGVGIFGNIQNATIKNLTSKSNTQISVSVALVGGICGSAFTSAFTNCHNLADIAGKSNVGGIVGCADVGCIVSYCSNTGNLFNDRNTIGGICGWLEGDIMYCYNLGNISSVDSSYSDDDVFNYGGIVGGMASYRVDSVSIKFCYNLGSVTSRGHDVGGIVRMGIWCYSIKLL